MPTIVEFTVKTPKLPSHRHNPVLLLDNTRILLHQLGCCVVVFSTSYSSHWVGHTLAALSPTLCHLVIYLLIIVLGQCPPADSAHRFPRPHQPAPHPTSKLHYNCQRRESFGTPKILIPSWPRRSDQFMDSTHYTNNTWV